MAIRPDPESKSASPRSGAPKGELEQYGVWVKAEPQDVIEEIAVPDDSTSLPEEPFLSEDEERLLDSFDSDFEMPSESSTDESGPLPDIEDMPSMDDSLLSPEPAPSMEEIEDIGPTNIDITLRDSESARPASPIHPGAALDMDNIEGFDSSSGAIEDVSSDFLDLAEVQESGGEAQVAPDSESGSELDDVTSEFLDVEDAGIPMPEDSPSVDFEPLDIDLQFDESTITPTEAGFEAVTEFDDFLSTEDASPPASDTGFDDVSAVEMELSTAEPDAIPITPMDQKPDKGDISSEILLKIAQELSSIRGELASLKTQIGEIIVSAEPAAAKMATPEVEESDEEGPSGGFFDDEEDETIALTGDELDNILNTADFTEEIAQNDEQVTLEEERSDPPMPQLESTDLLEETLLPESGDYTFPDDNSSDDNSSGDHTSPEPAIEEVRIGEADSIDEIDVVPITEAPDDTSYLDYGAPLNEEPLLADEALVEPDLSDFDLGPEDFESQLEIDEELPLAPIDHELANEDMTLDIDVEPGYNVEEPVVEAEMIEPVQEIEEPNFAEINLHEEELATDELATEDLATETKAESTELEEIEFLPDADFGAPPTPVPQAHANKAPLFEEEEDLVLTAEEEDLPASAPVAMKEPDPKPAVSEKKAPTDSADGDRLKSEIKSVLSYLDKLLDSLPEEKIEEFARSEYFDTYKKLFEELGLV